MKEGVSFQVDYLNVGEMTTDEIRTDESKLRLILYNLLSNSVRFSQNGLIRVKSRMLTISEAKERIDTYIKRLQETEQADSLLNYRRELENNFDSQNAFVSLYESSDSQDFNRSHDRICYERRLLHLIIEDNGSGIQL